MSTTTTASVQSILTNVTAVVTSAVTWISSYVGAIMDNPLIEVFVILSIAGMGVGLIRRLIRL